MGDKKRRGRGEGSITQLDDGRWLAILSLGKNPATGKRVQKKFYGKTKAEVVQKLEAAKEARRAGRLSTGADKLTLGEWLDKWLSHKQGRVEPHTWLWYEARAKMLKELVGSVRLSALTALQVEDLHAEMTRRGFSPDKQHKVATTLRASLEDAVRKGLIPSNPAKAVAKPRLSRREVRPWDAEQATRFLEAARGHRLQALYDLALDSGARQGELLALHWPDIDFDAGTLRIDKSLEEIGYQFRLKPPKTRKGRRTIRLAGRTLDSLQAHRSRMRAEGRDVESGPVFVNTEGGWLSKPSLYRNSFSKLLKRAGVSKIGFHGLRHTNATLLLQRGASLKLVSERLGHEDVQITLKIYAHVLPDDQDQAARLIDGLFSPPRTNVTQ
jgi:integrase